MNSQYPGKGGKSFRIILRDNYFNKGDELFVGKEKIKVLQKPYKKWYRKLLQVISFGFYEAPYGYKCKLIEMTDD